MELDVECCCIEVLVLLMSLHLHLLLIIHIQHLFKLYHMLIHNTIHYNNGYILHHLLHLGIKQLGLSLRELMVLIFLGSKLHLMMFIVLLLIVHLIVCLVRVQLIVKHVLLVHYMMKLLNYVWLLVIQVSMLIQASVLYVIIDVSNVLIHLLLVVNVLVQDHINHFYQLLALHVLFHVLLQLLQTIQLILVIVLLLDMEFTYQVEHV